MKKGSIGKVLGEASSIDTSVYPTTESKSGLELLRTLSVRGGESDLRGNEIQVGRAARQDVTKEKGYDIDPDGKVTSNGEEKRKITDVTEFMYSEDQYAVTESTKKEFAFSLLAKAIGTEVSSADIDMNGFIEAHQDARFWMAGYYNHSGEPTSGDGYAEGDLFESDEFRETFEKSDKNRIGVEFEFESELVKLLLTEGGYIEVYRPSNFDSIQFKRLIDEKISPYVV